MRTVRGMIFFTFFISISYCRVRKGQIQEKIQEKIDDCNGNCTLVLKDITPFRWDSVYFFQFSLPYQKINDIIKTKYPFYEEFTQPIIFFYKGNIVYHENNESGIEKIVSGQIVIGDNLMDTVSYKVFTKSNAIFRGYRKEQERALFYELIPIR